MSRLSKNRTGLIFGFLLSFLHLIWLGAVWKQVAKPFIDWVLSLHMISISYSISAFKNSKAVPLLILTFVTGYIFGWVLAFIWNFLRKR